MCIPKPGAARLAALLLTVLALGFTHASLGQEEDEDFFVFDEEESSAPEIADPLESVNRVTFALNDKIYRGILKPIARGLRVLPKGVRVSASNFVSNLGAPVSAISALLQADPKNALTEGGRFVVNTTLGIVGLFDPATSMGLIQDQEDLGQTLSRYGVGHGFYLVIPVIGASSARDFVGSIATSAINPVFEDLEAREIIAIQLIGGEVALSLDQDTYESFYESALDPYIFFRSAWVQNRAGKAEQ